MKKLLIATAVAALTSASAFAATTSPVSTTFLVTLIVQKACIVSAQNLAFGTQEATAGFVQGTNLTGITVNCSRNTPYTVGLAPTGSATSGAGTMKGTTGNTDTVAYQLRSTTGATGTVWGDDTTNRITFTSDGTAKVIPVYGTVNAVNNVLPDTYTDTVTVNVRF